MKKGTNKKQLQKMKTHQEILRSAAFLFRKQGYHATGIDQIMQRAGLTAGGFYAHFRSKTQLLGEVMEQSLDSSILALDPAQGLERYLSAAHRDHPEAGCILPVLGAEITRLPSVVRKTVSRRLAQLCDKTQNPQQSALVLATAVGSLFISRLLKDSELSTELLKDTQILLQNILAESQIGPNTRSK